MPDTTEITTPGYRYTLAREIDAPPTRVWAAWTEPAHFAAWFGATPESVALDVRPGGAWRATPVTPTGLARPLTGTYGDVLEHRHLVTYVDATDRDTPDAMDLRLLDLDGRTRVVLTQVADTAGDCMRAKRDGETLLTALALYLDRL